MQVFSVVPPPPPGHSLPYACMHVCSLGVCSCLYAAWTGARGGAQMRKAVVATHLRCHSATYRCTQAHKHSITARPQRLMRTRGGALTRKGGITTPRPMRRRSKLRAGRQARAGPLRPAPTRCPLARRRRRRPRLSGVRALRQALPPLYLRYLSVCVTVCACVSGSTPSRPFARPARRMHAYRHSHTHARRRPLCRRSTRPP